MKKLKSASFSSSSSPNKPPGLRGVNIHIRKLKEKLNWTKRGNLPGDTIDTINHTTKSYTFNGNDEGKK